MVAKHGETMSTLIDVAINLLSERQYTEHELKKQLEKSFADVPNIDGVINATIERLRELHLINDFHLAQSIALRYSHKGDRFIIQFLRQKGIDVEVIDKALAVLGDEYPRALDEARLKGRESHGERPEKRKAQLVRFLSGRGFSHETIKSVVSHLSEEGFFTCKDNFS